MYIQTHTGIMAVVQTNSGIILHHTQAASIHLFIHPLIKLHKIHSPLYKHTPVYWLLFSVELGLVTVTMMRVPMPLGKALNFPLKF